MPLRALIVDDSKVMRRNIALALQRLPQMQCFEAEDGAEALKLLLRSPFELLLTDINMPVMDGLKLILAARQQPQYARLPIVVITTEGADEDRAKAMALGANAYLVKPVQAKTIVDAVKTLLPP